MLSRLRDKLAGVRSNLAYSNRWEVLWQRAFHRNYPIVRYLWKRRWWIFCDTARLDPKTAEEVLLEGCYHSAILKSRTGKGLSYVNVGANIGAFDIAVAELAPEARWSIAAELNPLTFTRLKFNLQVNGLQHVIAVNAGIAGRTGTFFFQPQGCSAADNLYQTTQANTGDHKSMLVPLATLEGLLSSNAAPAEFDLLKLDCEGAEYEIMAECTNECIRRFRNVIIELHPALASVPAETLTQKLEACGFVSRESHVKFGLETRFWSRLK
jgi:FkbM family methyltransferase